MTLRQYLASLTPKQREDLKREMQIQEATASAELAKGESLRAKAKRLGLEDMPAELGQRSVDGETNYVSLHEASAELAKENEHDDH